jgi:predicted small metal-binding protein
MMSLACKDMGVEGCDFVAQGETKEEVMMKLGEHGASAHGMTAEMMSSPEAMAKAEAGMKME